MRNLYLYTNGHLLESTSNMRSGEIALIKRIDSSAAPDGVQTQNRREPASKEEVKYFSIEAMNRDNRSNDEDKTRNQ